MSSDVSFCIICNKPIHKGEVLCRECREKDAKEKFFKRY